MTEPDGRLPDDVWMDVQALVTTGYGSLPCSAYLWLVVNEHTAARQWLGDLVPLVRTAGRTPGLEEGAGTGESVAVNIAFTASGLSALGLPDSVLRTFPEEFVEGMAAAHRAVILGDTEASAPDSWELGGPANPRIDVAMIVHGRTESALSDACKVLGQRLLATGGAVAEIPAIAQQGYRPEHRREHFGFHDGIAQPKIGGRKGAGVPTGEFVLGYPNHYGLLPPTPVVPSALDGTGVLPPWSNPHHPPNSLRDLGRNGSYLVYRKLRQDVAEFWRVIVSEARRLTDLGFAQTPVGLASKMVGRWPDGRPLVPLTPPDGTDLDAFTYSDDRDGQACPFGAHIRRTHPRDVIRPYQPAESLRMSEAHRMLRRGRLFGPALFDPRRLDGDEKADWLAHLRDPGDERGVHFLSIQANIRRQFEFVQQTWCNNPHFAGLADNKDPIVGDNARPGKRPSHMSIAAAAGSVRTAALPRFVSVRGGAYLFVPSMAALRFLAGMRFSPFRPSGPFSPRSTPASSPWSGSGTSG